MIWVASRRLQVSRGSLRKRIVEYEDDYACLCNGYVLYGIKSENINLHIAILASPCYIDTIVESEMYWVSKRFWIIFAETSPVIFFFHLPQYNVSRQERLKLQAFVTPVWTLDCALKPSLITIIFILHVSSLFVYNVIQRSIISREESNEERLPKRLHLKGVNSFVFEARAEVWDNLRFFFLLVKSFYVLIESFLREGKWLLLVSPYFAYLAYFFQCKVFLVSKTRLSRPGLACRVYWTFGLFLDFIAVGRIFSFFALKKPLKKVLTLVSSFSLKLEHSRGIEKPSKFLNWKKCRNLWICLNANN